jgi:hypothetical protein
MIRPISIDGRTHDGDRSFGGSNAGLAAFTCSKNAEDEGHTQRREYELRPRETSAAENSATAFPREKDRLLSLPAPRHIRFTPQNSTSE